ncbi:MAG: GIY-YIG nuclease family protein [Bacillota bacterium]
MAHGFVYVLGNDSMPEIYKIGRTDRHPKTRMEELSRVTACPTPFELLAFIGCEDPQWVESEIHKALDDFRVNQAREFFRVDPWWIQDLLRQYGDPATDVFYDVFLDWEVERYQSKEELLWKRNHFFEQCADPIEWQTRRGFD